MDNRYRRPEKEFNTVKSMVFCGIVLFLAYKAFGYDIMMIIGISFGLGSLDGILHELRKSNK